MLHAPRNVVSVAAASHDDGLRRLDVLGGARRYVVVGGTVVNGCAYDPAVFVDDELREHAPRFDFDAYPFQNIELGHHDGGAHAGGEEAAAHGVAALRFGFGNPVLINLPFDAQDIAGPDERLVGLLGHEGTLLDVVEIEAGNLHVRYVQIDGVLYAGELLRL